VTRRQDREMDRTLEQMKRRFGNITAPYGSEWNVDVDFEPDLGTPLLL
jgi:hypothetical protein